MRVLMTGGTGVVGKGAIPELLAGGHTVRLLSRRATDQADDWPDGVECLDGDVTDQASLRGAADGCEVILHVTGIVDEQPPEITFDLVNVEGTRNIAAEAARAGVRRLVFVSSLGADRGDSAYHQSKRKAEAIVAAFPGEWIVLRPGHVFGPGDEMISMVLKMVRSSPVVPEVSLGQHRFQPIWYQDFGKALAACVDRPGLSGKTFELAGDDVLTVSSLIERLSERTNRPGVPIPVPAFVVRAAIWFYRQGQSLLRWKFRPPLNESKLTMLIEENVIPEGRPNALSEIFGVRPTPFADALHQLCQSLPENPPQNGVGQLDHKQFWIELQDASVDPVGLMTLFKDRIGDVMPIDFSAEPHAPRRIEYGETLSARLPGRGNIQVRVLECEPDRVTFATIEGHPLAGFVTFSASSINGGLRFNVDTWTRAANQLDRLAINVAGHWFQDLTWRHVVERTGRLSGGKSMAGVQHRKQCLDSDACRTVEEWTRDLIARARRERVEAHVAAKH